ncbi:MAG: zinc ribbon domain-containing protein [Thermoplasmata archaeon]|nr:zinc ribbon domain-containing protein [Thermoplasmata archaeon]
MPMDTGIMVLLMAAGVLGVPLFIVMMIRFLKARSNRMVVEIKSEKGLVEDEAYNSLKRTERILEYMRGKGMDTSSARDMLQMAREAYGDGDRVASLDYSDRAKVLLMHSKEQMAAQPSPPVEEEPEQEIAGTLSTAPQKEDPRMARLNRGQEEEEGIGTLNELHEKAQEALDQRSNKLPAKFMIQRARESLDKVEEELKGDGSEEMDEVKEGLVEDGLEELDKAEEAFDNEDYARALYHANRARKLAEGEDITPDAHVAVGDGEVEIVDKGEETRGEREEGEMGEGEIGGERGEGEMGEGEIGGERGEGEMEEPKEETCPSCGEKVEEDSMFCRHCGTRLLEEILVCSGCGKDIPVDSVFCPKCGHKIG